jgi:hypothetical protein
VPGRLSPALDASMEAVAGLPSQWRGSRLVVVLLARRTAPPRATPTHHMSILLLW